MLTISREQVQNIMRLELLTQQREIVEQIAAFEKKYGCTFAEFGRRVNAESENFEHWDDYMEWKAAMKVQAELAQNLTELQYGNFSISSKYRGKVVCFSRRDSPLGCPYPKLLR